MVVKKNESLPAVAGGLAQNSTNRCKGRPGKAGGVLLRAVTVGKPIKFNVQTFTKSIFKFEALKVTFHAHHD